VGRINCKSIQTESAHMLLRVDLCGYNAVPDHMIVDCQCAGPEAGQAHACLLRET